jgi:sugar-specific transcriptional regulator TrmB
VSDVIAGLRRDLEQRLKEIERQLAEHEPLLREREQIQDALAQPPFTASGRPAPAAAPKRAASRKPAAKRAPRGANREAILKAVDERPGASASEIADVTKISRAVTYNTLAKLVEQGTLEKTSLPGGQTGYKPATPAEAQPGL